MRHDVIGVERGPIEATVGRVIDQTSLGLAVAVLRDWGAWQRRPADRRDAGRDEVLSEAGARGFPGPVVAAGGRAASTAFHLSGARPAAARLDELRTLWLC